ncbi:hypothetical protein KIN20_038012 [Parelaphostrongylus tenuis]|uniref:Uncharacterized protein n=1 Tax=Parelaphostrongylus tenuis TaxID=148309 RepID=A0AAD5WMA4_PARTN|nr:hypothetical protein KIN20_038012 [Parelaphostrongylus tenuis]
MELNREQKRPEAKRNANRKVDASRVQGGHKMPLTLFVKSMRHGAKELLERQLFTITSRSSRQEMRVCLTSHDRDVHEKLTAKQFLTESKSAHR